MRGTSRPRAATSVATSTSTFPALKRSMAFSRAAWFRSPWSGVAGIPRASSRSDSSAAAFLVRAKTSTPSQSSASRIRTRASSLESPRTCQNRWFTASTVVVRASIRTSAGSLSERPATRAIAGGMVAENSAVCRSSGAASRIAVTSSRKPMRSISSASSRTTARIPERSRVPRRRWSWTRPGVPTTTCTPRRSSRSCWSMPVPP